MLRLNSVEVVYDDVVLVLRGLSLEVSSSSIVCLLGSNGTGKSTTLKAISGLLGPEEGAVTDGTIVLDGEPIQNAPPHEVVRRGVSQVLEGRRVFEHLTVDENLVVGGYTRGVASVDEIYDVFPRLAEHRRRLAGFLSGGEQQMLAIGRALMARPRLLLLDEPSLGLAPRLVQEIFATLVRLNEHLGTTMLLVEQNAARALEIAHYGYVMENGRVVLEGRPEELRDNADIKEFYLGLSDLGERRSYRDVKRYRRRKRWLS
jgi:branched-chain amino acid transport system ATP-binding protein